MLNMGGCIIPYMSVSDNTVYTTDLIDIGIYRCYILGGEVKYDAVWLIV